MNELEQRSAVRAHLLPILLLQRSSSKLISFMKLIIKYGLMSRHRIYLKISCHPFYLSVISLVGVMSLFATYSMLHKDPFTRSDHLQVQCVPWQLNFFYSPLYYFVFLLVQF